jgi:hypothetical protein
MRWSGGTRFNGSRAATAGDAHAVAGGDCANDFARRHDRPIRKWGARRAGVPRSGRSTGSWSSDPSLRDPRSWYRPNGRAATVGDATIFEDHLEPPGDALVGEVLGTLPWRNSWWAETTKGPPGVGHVDRREALGFLGATVGAAAVVTSGQGRGRPAGDWRPCFSLDEVSLTRPIASPADACNTLSSRACLPLRDQGGELRLHPFQTPSDSSRAPSLAPSLRVSQHSSPAARAIGVVCFRGALNGAERPVLLLGSCHVADIARTVDPPPYQ